MKVVLISTDQSRSIIGARTLSSCLAGKGFAPTIVAMAAPGKLRKVRWEDLREICKDACLIGLSCMTHGMGNAVEVKSRLRERSSCPTFRDSQEDLNFSTFVD